MKTNPVDVVSARSFALALLVGLVGLPAGAATFDDFESYTAGSNLHGQGDWSGWAGDPSAGAVVSSAFSFSPTRSVNITGASDLVHTFSGATNGQWVFKAMQYVPSTSSGTNYVILLNRYHPPFAAADLNWSVQIQNNMNSGQIISDLGGGATRPMVKNQWVEIRVEINLASNTVTEFYNGQPLSTHVWQDGTGLNQLQALDLFAADSGPVYYDNVSLAPAPTPAPALRISNTGPDPEGLPTFQLEWDAISNATYGVQVSTDLASGSWETIDLVTPTGNLGSYKIPAANQGLLLNLHLFSRLVLPQPHVTAVEPAIFPPGVPVDAYVIGQCFESTDVVRVDGVPLSGVIYLSHNMLQGPMPTLSVGGHLVELVRGGVVLSSFTVTCADPVANPELVLQGPPEEPPAAPRRPVGRITFKAKEGATLARGLTDKIRENDNVVFDVAEGKKGLNAVNVKLARTARTAGGGEELPKESLEFNYGFARSGKITKSRSNIQNNRMTGGVQPFSGEVQLAEVDFAIPGRGLDFVWARTYRSRPGNQGVINFTVTRWTYSYDVSVVQTAAGIAVTDGTGRLDTFKLQTNGTYTCPQFFREGTINNNTFTLTFADTGRWVFNPFDSSLTAGKLRQIITRNGDTMTLGYDTSGRLAQIVDDLDRTNTIAYNTSGQLASVTDFTGRTVRYEYDGNGDLVACVSPPVTGTPNGNDFPGGKTNRYTYSTGYLDDRENHLLLSVIDPTGQVIYKHVYQHNQTDLEFLRCISFQRWTNTPTTFSYLPQTPTSSNQFATLRCIVNDPVGNVTEYFSDARNRCVKLQEFTGRAVPGSPVTATVNRPVGKLRTSDPDYYETLAEWNNDSLLSKLKVKREYSGDKTFSTWYASDFDPATSARKRADLRILREIASSAVDVDGDGIGDITERAWRYTYDSRFGSDRKNSRVKVQLHWDRVGKDDDCDGLIDEGNPDLAGKPINTVKVNQTAGEQCDNDLRNDDCGFVTFATDPRGNVTTGSYDTNGNCAKITRTGVAAGTYAIVVDGWEASYNSRGQLTSITNTAADANGYHRVDTFSYYTNGPALGYLRYALFDSTSDPVSIELAYDARGNLTRFVDPRGHDRLYTYNALNQLVRYQTPTNLTARTATDFTYDANDNVVRVETERRDENDLIIQSLPTRGKLYQYNSLNRCTEIVQQVSANHFITNRFYYDANDNVVAVHSPLAVSGADPHAITQFEYDERDLPFRTIAAPGSTVQSTSQWDYDANGNVTRVSEGLEGTPRVTTLEYDGFAGSGVSFDAGARYAAAGATCTWSDGLKIAAGSIPGLRSEALATRAKEDTSLRLSEITDPLGNVTTFNYDANDNLKVFRHFGQLNDGPGTNGNIRLAESRWKYDGLDRRIEVRTAFFNPATQAPIGDGASLTSFAYAPNGQCTNVTDDLGHTTTFAYNRPDRIYVVKVPAGKSLTACLLDKAGNITQATQTDAPDLGGPPQVFSRTNVYDAWNRLVSTTDNVGNNENWNFGSDGALLRSVDARGAITRYEYDLLGRPTKTFQDMNGNDIVEAVDVVTTQTWDDNSRLSSCTDDNTNTTFYACDSRNRQILVTSPDGTHSSLVWSPRSNLILQQDANGTVISNTFDLLDRCVRRDISPGPGVAITTTFETFAYNGLSQLVAVTNDVSHSEFDYDSMGNCTGNHADGWNVARSEYDSVGNRVSLTYPSGRIVTYAYDALDQVTNVSSAATAMTPPKSLAQFAYAGPGRPAQITCANGTRTDIAWNGLVSPPNAPGDFGRWQPSGIGHTIIVGGAVIDQRRFAYDRNQNKILRAQTVPFYVGGNTITNFFEYDALNQLHQTETTLGASLKQVAYALDGDGNRQLVVSNGMAMPYFMDNTPLPGPADFQMDQYTMTPFGFESHDENGNRTGQSSSIAQLQYQYDYANRLVQVNDLTTGSAVPVVGFAYNALGLRIRKTVYPPAPSLPVTIEHIRDTQIGEVCDDGNTDSGDGCRILEMRVGGALSDVFVHVSGLKEEIRENDSVFRSAPPLVRFNPTGVATYFHADDLGNVLALTDDLGNVIGRNDYDDFGLPIFLTSDGFPIATNASPTGNPFLFHGMEWDSETGLYLERSGTPVIEWTFEKAWPCRWEGADFYDPQTGRAIRGKRDVSRFRDDPYAEGARLRDPQTSRGFNGNNPWSRGGGDGSGGFVLKKEEGGRHTPFHNKYRPQFRMFSSISNVLKTRHDTAKNSVGNIR